MRRTEAKSDSQNWAKYKQMNFMRRNEAKSDSQNWAKTFQKNRSVTDAHSGTPKSA